MIDWAQMKTAEQLAEATRSWPKFTGNAKLDLFTPAEQFAVAEAAATDPLVALTFYRMINAVYMSYEDPETEQGLVLLQDKGLLLPNRKAEIVAKMQPTV